MSVYAGLLLVLLCAVLFVWVVARSHPPPSALGGVLALSIFLLLFLLINRAFRWLETLPSNNEGSFTVAVVYQLGTVII